MNLSFFTLGCGDGGAESGDGGAASASPRVEEPPPVPPAAAASPSATTSTLPVPADVSPTAESWEAEADDALLTPEENNEPDDEEIEQQVCISYFYSLWLIKDSVLPLYILILCRLYTDIFTLTLMTSTKLNVLMLYLRSFPMLIN